MSFLFDYQQDAVNRLTSGKILCGGVGSGKSRTGLYYWFKENGGQMDPEYKPMTNPVDLYIITTAKKRNDKDWERELGYFYINIYSENKPCKITIDSWNNINKYTTVSNSFFIFDEQRVVGKGMWVKSFYKITATNQWILLTATPGDNYQDYVPVFIANGYFKNRTQFEREHCIFNPHVKWRQVDRYIATQRLDRLRKNVLVIMNYKHKIDTEDVYIPVNYDRILYKAMVKNRWDIWENRPFKNVSGYVQGLRKIVNSDESRMDELIDILHKKRRIIVFYNFDYELAILKSYDYGPSVNIGELNGHRHDPVPDSSEWLYFCQYNAAAEAWECITTDTIVFYSLNHSYKIMKQSAGRTDRLNTPYNKLYYYYLVSTAPIDVSIRRCLALKKDFNARAFAKDFGALNNNS